MEQNNVKTAKQKLPKQGENDKSESATKQEENEMNFELIKHTG